MNTQDNHPSKQTLFDFARGKLEADLVDEVSRHIENCATCVEFLEKSADDTFIDHLRDAAANRDPANADSGSFDINQTQHFQREATVTSIDELFANHPKYKLINQIGSGGMGAVFEAQHRMMDRVVAIKVIRPELVSNSEAVARFHNEVKAAARLSHRNIVAAYDAEQVGAAQLLVMEYVVGESLSQTVARKGQLPVTHACNYILQVAQGLKHADEQGMIHRDIKPHNLMKTPKGVIKILDFGLARMGELHDDDSKLTSTGVMMGTADYIAPEQARDAKSADIRSDLYSLGCTFYYLLSGKAPFKTAETRVDKILSHCTETFPDIAALRTDVPDEVQNIIAKLTAKSPSDRFQNPQQLIDALLPYARRQSSGGETGHPETIVQDQHGEQPTAVIAAGGAANTDEAPSADRTFEVPIQTTPARNSQSSTPIAQPALNEERITPHLPEANENVGAGEHNAGRQKTAKQKMGPAIWMGLASLGIVFLILILYVSGAFNGSSSDRPNQSNSGSSGAKSTDQKTVAVIFVYDQFCYGDFGPMRDRLESDEVKVVTASTTKRTARFIDFPEDKTPNKQNVEMQFSLSDLESMASENNLSGVVFIGGSQMLDGVNDQTRSEGRAISQLVETVRKNEGWIAAIGKGVNVPYSLGLLDNCTIVDVGQWLEAGSRDLVATRSDRVFTDQSNRVITAVEWRDSTAMADELLQRLR